MTRRTDRKPRHRAIPLVPELRYFQAGGLEVREQPKTNQLILRGQPIVYGRPYDVVDHLGSFSETMLPGVARDVLARGADVRFLYDHGGLVLARTTSGTMTLSDSATGLNFEARLDARQQLANDLAIAVERGDCNQMSCGFMVAEDEWNEDFDQRSVVRFAELLDVSAVTYPCSPTTTIEVAQRLRDRVPIESRARLRNIIARAGAGGMSTSDRAALAELLSDGEPQGYDDWTGPTGSLSPESSNPVVAMRKLAEASRRKRRHANTTLVRTRLASRRGR